MCGEIGVGGWNWIWMLYNMTFESRVMLEAWNSAMIVQLYKGKWERIKYKNYRGIVLLSMAGKIYPRILVHRVYSVLVCDWWWARCFQIREGIYRSNFHIKADRCESTREKTKGVCRFYRLEKLYDGLIGKLFLNGIKSIYI